MYVFGGPHPYSGSNLGPDADLYLADLTNAVLIGASLFDADLANTNLSDRPMTPEICYMICQFLKSFIQGALAVCG